MKTHWAGKSSLFFIGGIMTHIQRLIREVNAWFPELCWAFYGVEASGCPDLVIRHWLYLAKQQNAIELGVCSACIEDVRHDLMATHGIELIDLDLRTRAANDAICFIRRHISDGETTRGQHGEDPLGW